MKKLFLVTAMLIFSPFLFASKGYAADGLELILAICVVLLIIAGIFKGFDLIQKNRRTISGQIIRLTKQIYVFLKKLINRIHLNLECVKIARS